MLIGATLGLIAGYCRGWVDTCWSRGMDIVLAFPVLRAGDRHRRRLLGRRRLPRRRSSSPGWRSVIVVIVIASWPYIARLVRGQVLSLREKEFVEAARSLGASDRRIIFREILPNLVAPLIVYATMLIPQNILFEAALSFLGVGIDPQKPSWGAMISDATSIFRQRLVVHDVPRPRAADHRAWLSTCSATGCRTPSTRGTPMRRHGTRLHVRTTGTRPRTERTHT